MAVLSCLIVSCDNSSKKPEVSTTIPIDSIEIRTDDEYYRLAYSEILTMIEESLKPENKGKENDPAYSPNSDKKSETNTSQSKPDFKRAVFLLEWAYLRGKLDYDTFCADISKHASDLKRFIKQRGVEQYKTAGNFALFEFFTKPNSMNGNKPYTYDFDDFTGREDYTKLFVTKLMRTHTGQCRSLPIFYKVLAEEIGAHACLALAPNHIYVKHLGEDNSWVNIELTNGNLASDAHLISSMAISAESIRNRVYLDALDMTQSLAFLLYELTDGYEKLYGLDNDFILQCCDKSLEYFPTNMAALFTKHNMLRERGIKYRQYLTDNGKESDSTATENHRQWRETQDRIESLGYREMPKEQYQEWITAVEKEKERQINTKK